VKVVTTTATIGSGVAGAVTVSYLFTRWRVTGVA
jgi:hypothetical protein